MEPSETLDVVELWDGERDRLNNEWWLITLMTCLTMCIAFNVTVISVRYWCSLKRDKVEYEDFIHVTEEKWHLDDEMNALASQTKSLRLAQLDAAPKT
uniref:Transmembrane protein n=1 Tax=Steinernema glaseri TaxID=37863 RepID=A0A1I7ZCD3_9BILA